MKEREPQVNENTKTTLFVTGNRTSALLKSAVADLAQIKQPHVQRFMKKNDIHPFEDASCMLSLVSVRPRDLVEERR